MLDVGIAAAAVVRAGVAHPALTNVTAIEADIESARDAFMPAA